MRETYYNIDKGQKLYLYKMEDNTNAVSTAVYKMNDKEIAELYYAQQAMWFALAIERLRVDDVNEIVKTVDIKNQTELTEKLISKLL